MRTSNGRTWWYEAAAIEKVGSGSSGPPECAARRPTAQGPHTCKSCRGKFRKCYGAYGYRDSGGTWDQGSTTDVTKYPESPNTKF
eukprot:COSAG02_NODE_44306_length_367_cov_1.011194_1_plen_84_part_10